MVMPPSTDLQAHPATLPFTNVSIFFYLHPHHLPQISYTHLEELFIYCRICEIEKLYGDKPSVSPKKDFYFVYDKNDISLKGTTRIHRLRKQVFRVVFGWEIGGIIMLKSHKLFVQTSQKMFSGEMRIIK